MDNKSREFAYQCEVCQVKFAFNVLLLKHLLSEHRPTKTKISSVIKKLVTDELELEQVNYSSESDCDYKIITTIKRTKRIKSEKQEVCEVQVTTNYTDPDYYDSDRDYDDLDTPEQNFSTPEEMPVECKLETEPTVDLKPKINIKNAESKFKCSRCGKRLLTKKTLQQHLRLNVCNKPIDQIKTFDCYICNKNVKYRGSTSKHLALCFSKNVKRIPKKPADESNLFKCEICGNTMKYQRSYAKHYRLFHSPQATKTIRFKNSPSLWNYECDLCGKGVKQKRSILKHFRIYHTEEKLIAKEENSKMEKHECSECDRWYSERKLLCRHMKIFHRMLMPPKKKVPVSFLCNICGRSFTSQSTLRLHMVRHSAEKPFKCDMCGDSFYSKRDITDHVLGHFSAKPYTCSVVGCGRTFARFTSMKMHNTYKHRKKVVVKREKKFQCTHCDMCFITITKLRRHIRSHTNERPYPCNTCDMKFKGSYELTLHQRTHTGYRPHQCKVCGKAYTKSSVLKAHKQRNPQCNLTEEHKVVNEFVANDQLTEKWNLNLRNETQI